MHTMVIDCNNICYGSLHTFGDLSFEEKKTGVIFGLLKMVLLLAKRFDTNRFVFCWDSQKSYRKILYPDYKGNRRQDLTEQEEADLMIAFGQFDETRAKVLPALGFGNVFRQNGYEADDIIAEVVTRMEGNFIVVSTDKDLYQLLDRCDIYNQKTKLVITKDDFFDKYKIPTHEWVEAKSLMGDSGDNIPGILGVGEVKAIKYMHNELPKGVIFDRIISKEGTDIVARNTRLIKLPYKGTKALKLTSKIDQFDKTKFISVFVDYGFSSMTKKTVLDQWVSIFCGGDKVVSA